MEHEKKGNIFPHSVRGLKKTFITPKEINPTNKKLLDEKFLLSSAFTKLTELLETTAQTNLQSLIPNNNGLSDSRYRKNSDTYAENFLVSHKPIFTPYRFYDEAKFSTKSYGSVIGYGVNTNQGIVRNYNEDRVSVILNVVKPPSRKNEEWPKVSFFGIFDGHGGTKCSDFLKENLHHYVWMYEIILKDI